MVGDGYGGLSLARSTKPMYFCDSYLNLSHIFFMHFFLTIASIVCNSHAEMLQRLVLLYSLSNAVSSINLLLSVVSFILVFPQEQCFAFTF